LFLVLCPARLCEKDVSQKVKNSTFQSKGGNGYLHNGAPQSKTRIIDSSGTSYPHNYINIDHLQIYFRSKKYCTFQLLCRGYYVALFETRHWVKARMNNVNFVQMDLIPLIVLFQLSTSKLLRKDNENILSQPEKRGWKR